MSPETIGPETGGATAQASPAVPAAVTRGEQPGLIGAVISILAGVVGFGIPVLGVVASFVGIWLGIRGIRLGHSRGYKPSVSCGFIGIILSVLCIVYWVCVILFESHS